MSNLNKPELMTLDEICDTWDNPESASIIEVRKALKGAIEIIKKMQKEIDSNNQKEDFTLYDLSGISAQEKGILINDFSILTASNAMKVYKSLGLKVGFNATMHNDPTNEDFILSFKKVQK
jgi:hypothetical protein